MTNSNVVSSLQNFSLRIPLKRAIALSIKNSDIPVEQIVEQMNQLTGEEITVNTLRNWSTITHENHVPRADLIPAFCEVTKNYLPLKLLLEPVNGIKIISDDEAAFFETLKLEKEESNIIHHLKKITDQISSRYKPTQEGL